LVTDHRRARLAAPRPLPADAAAPEPVADQDAFDVGWRADLLDRTWDALAAAHQTEHAVLLARVNDSDLPSSTLAEQVSARLGRPLTAAAARKALQRAHADFAVLLVQEVARSLDTPTPEALEEELRALDLLRYCRTALTKPGPAVEDRTDAVGR